MIKKECEYLDGLIIAPPDGDYKIYIDGWHVLTKRIKNNEGHNVLPWFTEIYLLPWRGIVKQYDLPTGDFTVVEDVEEKCIKLVYKDGNVIDRIRKYACGLDIWAGGFFYKGVFKFWFKMVKV
jgi:hypothetical protein